MGEHSVEWQYQTENVVIVPYIGGMRSPVFPDDFIVSIYYKLKKDDTLRRMLPDESIHTLSGFIAYFHGKQMLLCYQKLGDGIEMPLLGAVWIYDVAIVGKNGRASVGVFFFREYWGYPMIRTAGRLALKWLFQEKGLSVVVGTIAAWNRSSVKFGKEMGFSVCGLVPRFFLKAGVSVDMVMVALKAEDFRDGQG